MTVGLCFMSEDCALFSLTLHIFAVRAVSNSRVFLSNHTHPIKEFFKKKETTPFCHLVMFQLSCHRCDVLHLHRSVHFFRASIQGLAGPHPGS